MEFSKKGTMAMNGHFSPINGLVSFNGIQFSLCGTSTNLIFAHKVSYRIIFSMTAECKWIIWLWVWIWLCANVNMNVNEAWV